MANSRAKMADQTQDRTQIRRYPINFDSDLIALSRHYVNLEHH